MRLDTRAVRGSGWLGIACSLYCIRNYESDVSRRCLLCLDVSSKLCHPSHVCVVFPGSCYVDAFSGRGTGTFLLSCLGSVYRVGFLLAAWNGHGLFLLCTVARPGVSPRGRSHAGYHRHSYKWCSMSRWFLMRSKYSWSSQPLPAPIPRIGSNDASEENQGFRRPVCRSTNNQIEFKIPSQNNISSVHTRASTFPHGTRNCSLPRRSANGTKKSSPSEI
jgi:hypothetical protein